jgi:drug/metabolite transporter (DMT)-like permease
MNTFLGILLQILAMLCFTLQGAQVRHLAGEMPLGELVFARSLFGLIPLLLLLAWQRKLPHALYTRNVRAHVSRGMTNLSGMFFNYAGLARIPLADATAIGYATPLFTVILAALFLGEIVRLWRWGAVIVGFLGVLLMLWPYLGAGAADAAGAFFVLIASFLFGVAMTQVRHMTATETTGALVFYYSVLGTILSLVTIFWGWVLPDGMGLLSLFMLGIVGGLAQILMTESFRHAPASVLAPFAYTSMIWAVAIGYLWFGEVPEAIVLVGAAIVIGAGLFVIWREHRLGLDRRRMVTSAEPPA